MKSIEHKTSLIFDLFFCLVLMPLMMIAGPAYYWWEPYLVFTLIVTAYLYGCYFAIMKLKFPKLIVGRAYGRIAAILGGMMLVTWLLTLYPLPKMDFVTPSLSEYQTSLRNYNVALSLWLMFSVVIGYGLSVSFVKELYERMMLQSIAENQRNKAELEVFKAQISPHFLFNTLNSLYSLVIGTSAKAEDAFIKFTDILKYTYVTIGNEFVALSEEAEYIRSYIDLQMIRLEAHTKVEYDYSADRDDTLIPPMIFLTFVENAFKYGASATHDTTVYIRLHLAEGVLTFETENRVLRHRDEFRTEMPVGLENCRSRLAGLFPGRHELVTEENDGVFKVTLRIDVNNEKAS